MNPSDVKPAPVERRMLSAAVDRKDVAELYRRAAEQDRSASSLVRAALRRYLDEADRDA